MKHLQEHSLRIRLSNEAHVRPYTHLDSPVRASHLAILNKELSLEQEHTHLNSLCERYQVRPPAEKNKHFSENFGLFTLTWERHTEFSTYTFFRQDEEQEPFTRPVIREVPDQWLEGIGAKIMVAQHIVLLPSSRAVPQWQELNRYFVADSIVGGKIMNDTAQAWTDFRLHQDGFSRVLIQDLGLQENQIGRVVQELFEMESYRILALMGFPLAETVNPTLTQLDQRLAGLTRQIVSMNGFEEDQTLLKELASLEAEIEKVNSETAYRFGATRAYHAIVDRRIKDLNEQETEGMQTLSSFLERRFLPAMRTCESISDRIEQLSSRVARASQILSARVNFALEAQNRSLLHSMNRRAQYQLRLQETVEGLSIAVISYYVLALIDFLLQAISAAGYEINTRLILGFFIFPIILSVWFGVRRMRRTLIKNPDKLEDL